jgi:hypothetical protein
MSASRQAGNVYSQVFVFRIRMKAFLADLGERRGWSLAAKLLESRFTSEFIAFLDAPTPVRLEAVLALKADIADLDSRFNKVRPGYQPGPEDMTRRRDNNQIVPDAAPTGRTAQR